MKIIVCGAGMVGRNIARYLASEGNSVTVIDNDPLLVRQMTDQFDFKGITGFASHPDILEDAGARDADMIIASTSSDEVNMVICQVAHSVFNINEKIARLRTDNYTKAIYADMYRREHMPVDVVISPEKAVAKAIARRLRKPSAFDAEFFFDGQVQFLGIKLDDNCPVVHTPIRQLTQLFQSFKGAIVGVRRDDQLFIPDGDSELYVGDEIYIFVDAQDERRAYEIFGKSNDNVSNIIIIGGGEVAYSVASIIEDSSNARIKIIERDRTRAEEIADMLSSTVVLHGDGLDPILLSESNVSNADMVVSVTNDDKTNLLAAARAKSMGAKHAISVINETDLEDLADPLNIDTVLNPKAITVSEILQHIRQGRIHAVYVVGDNEAEVIEAEILSTSSLNGRMLGEIGFPHTGRIGAIKRGDEIIIPTGDTKFRENDWVTIFALREHISDIERFFRVTIDYF